MEPMSLGSPVGGPGAAGASPMQQQQPQQQPQPQQYLPPYLMGETSPTAGSPQTTASPRGFHMSPSKDQASSQTYLLLRTPRQSVGQSPRVASIGEKHHHHHHHGGPPTKSLFQGGRPSPITPMSAPATPSFYSPGPPMPPMDTTTLDSSRAEGTTTAWVTVFGFPPSAASFVLQQFSGYGTVVERRPGATPGSNWMHLRYATPLQAHRALSKNGRIFGGSVMVGVVPYHPQGAPDDSQKENVFPSWSRIESPIDSTTLLDEGSPLTGMRPLTQAYEVSRAEHEVVQKSQTPRKSTSVVSKAMEYVFGW